MHNNYTGAQVAVSEPSKYHLLSCEIVKTINNTSATKGNIRKKRRKKNIVVKFLTSNVVTGIRRAVYAGREAFTQKGERQTRNYAPLVPVKS